MRIFLCVCLAATAAGLWCASGDAQHLNQVGPFMRAKLTHSQRLLEAITLEDYELIAKQAQDLSLLDREANCPLSSDSCCPRGRIIGICPQRLPQAALELGLPLFVEFGVFLAEFVNCH